MSCSTGECLTLLLKTYGVEDIFGISDAHNVKLHRGLAGNCLRHITPRHEQGL